MLKYGMKANVYNKPKINGKIFERIIPKSILNGLLNVTPLAFYKVLKIKS
jgi:hypothetical protein